VISFAALGRFAAELLGFLVAMGGIALVALRPELLGRRGPARAGLAAGFGLMAAASFLEGSLIVKDRADPAIVAVRAAGLIALVLGSRQWAGSPRSQRLLWIGLAAMLLATGLLAAGVGPAADVALGIGGAGIGAALRVASARSLAARVAADSVAILLLVVLVLSVSLSAVLSTTVRNDAGQRLDARVATETDFAEKTEPQNAVLVARNVALFFAVNTLFANATAALLAGGNLRTGTLPAYPASTFTEIEQYLAPNFTLAYINTTGHVYAEAAPTGFDPGVVSAAIGSQDVSQAFADPTGGQRASVGVFGSKAFVVAVQTVARSLSNGTVDYPTAIVAVAPLDNGYLTSERLPIDPKVSLAIVSRDAVLAQAGTPGSGAALVALANRTFNSSGQAISLATGGGLLSATQVLDAGTQPVAVLVAATPATVVTDARDKLLRTLFLLALVGTLVALALAAYSGERVSGGIRALTGAAERIKVGNFDEPSGVVADDEVGVLGEAFDSMVASISEKTTALQQAAEDEAGLRNQLQAVVAGMGDALIAIDAGGVVSLFNRAAEELVGLDADDVMGEPVADVLVALGEDGSVLGARLQRPSPTRWSVNATIATELGPRIPVAITSGALRGLDGSVAGAVLILRDLRPEREVERLKSEFLSRIGHELRTPLTGILGYAEILLRRPVPEARAREMHQQIVDAGRRLYRVVQMLEFSAAAEAGRSLLRSEPLSVRTVVDEVVGGWTTRVNGNHSVARRVQRRLPEIRGDRRWLTMAIDELVDNAVKFSPDGGQVRVTATAVDWDEGGHTDQAVQISVSDEGVGMTEAEQRGAFAEFVQADGSDTRRFGGLGLGLSLVRRVAEAHGGRVDVASAPDKGSRFSITIPVSMEDA
jgi:PAS domain S-box-containing protein